MSNLGVLIDAPILLLQLLVSGILVGAIFALVAYGMALVWGVMNIINIAQGEFVMLGGYVVFYLDRAGVHPVFGIPIAAAALGIGAGFAICTMTWSRAISPFLSALPLSSGSRRRMASVAALIIGTPVAMIVGGAVAASCLLIGIQNAIGIGTTTSLLFANPRLLRPPT